MYVFAFLFESVRPYLKAFLQFRRIFVKIVILKHSKYKVIGFRFKGIEISGRHEPSKSNALPPQRTVHLDAHPIGA